MPVSYSEQSAGPSTRRAAAADETWSPPAEDYSGWTKAELANLAADLGLPTSGTKADLIERLSG